MSPTDDHRTERETLADEELHSGVGTDGSLHEEHLHHRDHPGVGTDGSLHEEHVHRPEHPGVGTDGSLQSHHVLEEDENRSDK